jgi:hypothetical protein
MMSAQVANVRQVLHRTFPPLSIEERVTAAIRNTRKMHLVRIDLTQEVSFDLGRFRHLQLVDVTTDFVYVEDEDVGFAA